MNSATWQKIEELFAEAIELPADRRGAFCDKACGVDAALRDELRTLLRSHATDETLLDTPPCVLASGIKSPEVLAPGTRIGVWSVGALIRRGGAGEVYFATRADGQRGGNTRPAALTRNS